MALRHYSLIVTMFAAIGCKTVINKSNLEAADETPLEVPLSLSLDKPATDSKPSQFWLHSETGKQNILATRKSANGLSYISGNDGINLPVSAAAQHCMHEIFRIIERSQAEKSQVWADFTAQHPYRFLEPLAELHDFYSQKNDSTLIPDRSVAKGWLHPVLWNGFKSASSTEPGSSGFKVRGYIKWRGVLLGDGKTCLIARPDQITDLLQSAMTCEAGDHRYCNFSTEDL